MKLEELWKEIHPSLDCLLRRITIGFIYRPCLISGNALFCNYSDTHDYNITKSDQRCILWHDQYAYCISFGRKVQSPEAVGTLNKTSHYQKMTIFTCYSFLILSLKSSKSSSKVYTFKTFGVLL